MPKKKLKKSHEPSDEKLCRLCSFSYDDEAIYGKLIENNGERYHYFCLLFACGLPQQGEDTEGIFGFLPEDIKKEISRATRLKCSFCKRYTAASACALKECRTKYHVPCALQQNSVLFHYYDSFESYCVKHRDEFGPKIDDRYNKIDDEQCFICLEKFVDQENNENNENLKYQVLLTSCCSKFLHINCVKRQCFNAGIHFTRCPLCNDRDNFIECVQIHGVFLPDEDAKWEQNENAWRDQESRYEHCDAIKCKCPFNDGRNYVGEDDSEWAINICCTCGSYGVHTGCLIDETIDLETFECPDCLQLSSKLSITFDSSSDDSVQIISEQVNNLSASNAQLKICEQNEMLEKLQNQKHCNHAKEIHQNNNNNHEIDYHINSSLNISQMKESIDSQIRDQFKANGQMT